MRAAAVREDATEKNAVTPGPIAPARELLGEMLLQLKQPAEALKEFQATLKKSRTASARFTERPRPPHLPEIRRQRGPTTANC